MEAVVDFGESSPYDPRRKECKHELGKPKSLVPGISLGEPQRGEPSLDEALVGHGAGPVGFDVPDKNGVHGILNLVETAGEPPPLLTPRELDAHNFTQKAAINRSIVRPSLAGKGNRTRDGKEGKRGRGECTSMLSLRRDGRGCDERTPRRSGAAGRRRRRLLLVLAADDDDDRARRRALTAADIPTHALAPLSSRVLELDPPGGMGLG